MSKHFILVYGSLLKGLHNHGVLGDSKMVGTTTVTGTLYSLGGFPGYKQEGTNDIKCEVYEVDDATLRRLDRLEGHPSFYTRTDVIFSFDDTGAIALSASGMVYVWQGTPTARTPVVESGDWRKFYIEQAQKEGY